VTGIRHWIEQSPIPGLEVSLFWGAVNLILVSVSILVAAEVPEWRTLFRIKQRLSCDLVAGEERLRGVVVDINETGARVHMKKQAQGDLHGPLLCMIKDRTGKYLTLKAGICRQSQLSPREVGLGLKCLDVNEQQTTALIAMTFSDSSVWNKANVEPGIFRSLWSVFRAFHKVWSKSRPSHRQFHRVPYRQECRLVFHNRIVPGTLEQISPTGLSVHIPGSLDLVGAQGMLHAGTCSLKIRRTWMRQCENMVHAGFTIERVEKGAEQWRELTTLAA
jgi:hypothetical protein